MTKMVQPPPYVLDELTGGLATKTRDVAEATELFNFKFNFCVKVRGAAVENDGKPKFFWSFTVWVENWDNQK